VAVLGPAVPEAAAAAAGRSFSLDLPGGLRIQGRWGAEGQAGEIQGSLRGQPLDLPGTALLVCAGGLPGVAGGPADPGAWDRWFGEPQAAPRHPAAEQQARQRKAEALPAGLAALYEEVGRMRRSGRIEPERLEAIRGELLHYPEDWLLEREREELLALVAPLKA
jgi:phenylalanine-4-hydroxylase